MKIVYIFICIAAIALFVLGSYNIEYYDYINLAAEPPKPVVQPPPPKPVVPEPPKPVVQPPPPKPVVPEPPKPVVPEPPKPIVQPKPVVPEPPKPVVPEPPKPVVQPKPVVPEPPKPVVQPKPIFIGQTETNLITNLTQANVSGVDKITTKIAPQDFLELSIILGYLTKQGDKWNWQGPAIASIPPSTIIIDDLNKLKITNLEQVNDIRGLSQIELSKLLLLGKLKYLNGKWSWNYTTTPDAFYLTDKLNNSNIKSVNDVNDDNTKFFGKSETVKDMMNSRFLILVDDKWVWNSVIKPSDYDIVKRVDRNGALYYQLGQSKTVVIIAAIVFFTILFGGIYYLKKSN